jgi:hypothetical protein
MYNTAVEETAGEIWRQLKRYISRYWKKTRLY